MTTCIQLPPHAPLPDVSNDSLHTDTCIVVRPAVFKKGTCGLNHKHHSINSKKKNSYKGRSICHRHHTRGINLRPPPPPNYIPSRKSNIINSRLLDYLVAYSEYLPYLKNFDTRVFPKVEPFSS